MVCILLILNFLRCMVLGKLTTASVQIVIRRIHIRYLDAYGINALKCTYKIHSIGKYWIIFYYRTNFPTTRRNDTAGR